MTGFEPATSAFGEQRYYPLSYMGLHLRDVVFTRLDLSDEGLPLLLREGRGLCRYRIGGVANLDLVSNAHLDAGSGVTPTALTEPRLHLASLLATGPPVLDLIEDISE